jgi:hypothetical protein
MSAKRVTAIGIVIAAIAVAAVTLSLTWSRGSGPLGGSAAGNKGETASTGSLPSGAAAGAPALGNTDSGSPSSTSNDALGPLAHPDWPPPPAHPHPDTDQVLAYPYRFIGPGR